jgi:RNA polymerase sigma factor (sigma-70 family)
MDHDLVLRARDGDRRAFEALVASEYGRMFRLAQGILRDPHLALDATQQAFVDIWRDLGRLRDPSRFEGWSYRVLVRICYAEAKHRRALTDIDVTDMRDLPALGDPFVGIEDRDRLERGFARLSADHRVIVVMRFLLDMTPDEIAETLEIPRRTVYSRLKRAMRALRATLEADARPSSHVAVRRGGTIG